jgi:aspartate aminotransferase
MAISLSPRLKSIAPSLTLALDDQVRRLQASGQKIINLTVGQPDFDTPAWISRAAQAAIAEGFTRYTSPAGMIELRRAAAEWLSRKGGASYGAEEVLVSSGSKHALYNALRAIINPGDEVIVPVPYWVSYPDLVRMADGVPIHPVTTLEQGYKLSAGALKAALSPRTRAIILNSPSNPAGAVYARREAESLARVVLDHDLTVISDEIYDQILYDGAEHISMAGVLPGMKERTIVVNGVSKSYAMTGWRIGFAAGPRPVIEAMGRYQGQATGNPCSISQRAALAAITGTGPELDQMRRAYSRRRALVQAALSEIPSIEWRPPSGAFYFFLRVAGALGRRIGEKRLQDVEELVGVLIDRGVAVVPGSGFGSPDAMRLSFAVSDEDLKKGLEIIRLAFLEMA